MKSCIRRGSGKERTIISKVLPGMLALFNIMQVYGQDQDSTVLACVYCRELQLGTAAITSLVYVMDKYRSN